MLHVEIPVLTDRQQFGQCLHFVCRPAGRFVGLKCALLFGSFVQMSDQLTQDYDLLMSLGENLPSIEQHFSQVVQLVSLLLFPLLNNFVILKTVKFSLKKKKSCQ